MADSIHSSGTSLDSLIVGNRPGVTRLHQCHPIVEATRDQAGVAAAAPPYPRARRMRESLHTGSDDRAGCPVARPGGCTRSPGDHGRPTVRDASDPSIRRSSLVAGRPGTGRGPLGAGGVRFGADAAVPTGTPVTHGAEGTEGATGTGAPRRDDRPAHARWRCQHTRGEGVAAHTSAHRARAPHTRHRRAPRGVAGGDPAGSGRGEHDREPPGRAAGRGPGPSARVGPRGPGPTRRTSGRGRPDCGALGARRFRASRGWGGGSGQETRPRRNPCATAWARSRTPSLRNSRRACVFTVSSDR